MQSQMQQPNPSWDAFMSLGQALVAGQGQAAFGTRNTYCPRCGCPVVNHVDVIAPADVIEGGGPVGCCARPGIVGASSQWWAPRVPCPCTLTRQQAYTGRA